MGQEPARWLEAAILEAVNAQTAFLISGDAEEFLEVVNPEEVTGNCSEAVGVFSEEPEVLLGLQVAKSCLRDVRASSAGPERSQKSRQARRNKKRREKRPLNISRKDNMRQGRLEFAVSHAEVSTMEWADLRPTLSIGNDVSTVLLGCLYDILG